MPARMNTFKHMFTIVAVGLTMAAFGQSAVQFERQVLTEKFHSEGAHVGDFNKDGKLDIVSGPFWYEGPEFTKSHTFFEPKTLKPETEYSNAFLAFVDDLNSDGWDDIIIVGFPGEDTSWFENPKG